MPSIRSQSQALLFTQGVPGQDSSDMEQKLQQEFSALLDQISYKLEKGDQVEESILAAQIQQPVVKETVIQEPVEEPEVKEDSEDEDTEQATEEIETEEDDELIEQEEELLAVKEEVQVEEEAITEEVIEASGEEVVTDEVVIEESIGQQVVETVETTTTQEVAQTVEPETIRVAEVQTETQVTQKVETSQTAQIVQPEVQEKAPTTEEKVDSNLKDNLQKPVTDFTPQDQVVEEQIVKKAEQIIPQLAKEIVSPEQKPLTNTAQPQATDNGDLLRAIEQIVADRLQESVKQHTPSLRFTSQLAWNQAFQSQQLNPLRASQDFGFNQQEAAAKQVNSTRATQTENTNLGQKLDRQATSEASKDAKPEKLTTRQELRTLEKVQEALKEIAKSKDGKTISFRLDPPQLGNMRVDVSLRDGILHARLAADNPAVNQMLREKSAELQMMLRDLGLEVDTVSVSVRDDNPHSHQQHGAENEEVEKKFEQFVSAQQDANVGGRQPKMTTNSQMDHWVA